MIRDFKLSDLHEVNEWFAKRQLTALDETLIPQTGFIIPGMGAVFMYRTDSSFCLVENLITNPLTTQKERRMAIDELLKAVAIAAHEQGFKKVIGLSKNTGFFDTALTHGEYIGNYRMYVKEV